MWLERHKAFDINNLLPIVTVYTFESIEKKICDKFYKSLEDDHNENWAWDPENTIKAQGLFAATKFFEYTLSFPLVFNGLESLKPSVTKL